MVGCAVPEYDRPEFDRFKKDEAGEVVLRSLIYQGFSDWQGEEGMVCSIRSKQKVDKTEVISVKHFSMDFERDEVLCKSNRGAAMVEQIYKRDGFFESVDNEPQKNRKLLNEGKREVIDSYLFTVLPFLVGRYATSLEIAPSEEIDRVYYDVVIARFDGQGHMPPDAWYKLYYTHSTNRLEKVLFLADSGKYTGRYIWCDFANYAEFDGIIIPLYRTFTLAKDKSGQTLTPPFLYQWIYEVELTRVGPL